MSWLKVWSWYIIKSIFVREAVKVLFFKRVFVKQAWGVMRFLDHFCVNMLAPWLKFVAFFMSILANLGYLIFKIFWGSMPPDPPRRPRTHGKNWKYIHERWDPWTLPNPNWAPANLENMAFVALFSKLYAVPCDNWKENWNKAFMYDARWGVHLNLLFFPRSK